MTLRTDKDLKSSSTKLPDGPWVDKKIKSYLPRKSMQKKLESKPKKKSD